MRCVKGSISVILALTITLMLSFCMILIESARENTMLLKADVIFDTGLQCILAEYHVLLWEDYDLLYVDAGYGTEVPDYELVKVHMRDYIDKNLRFDHYGWLALEYEGMQMSEVLLATDFSGTDFYLQAVESAKESIGITYIEQIIHWLEQVESTKYMEDSIKEQLSETNRVIEDTNGSVVEVKEAVWGVDENGEPILLEEAEYETVDINNPLDNVFSGNLLLRQVLGETKELSNVKINTKALASGRALASGNAGNSKEDMDTLWNKVFFCKYILDHFGCYTDNGDFGQYTLCYPLEYIIGGKASDTANLEAVMSKLLLIREVDNYLCLLQDEIKKAEAEAIGTAIASAAYVPWLGPVLTQAMLLYWAYEDSVADLQQLVQGKEVPLVKSLGLGDDFEICLDYKEYLILLLLMQNKENLIMRSIDMIETYVREEQSNFRMDGCIGSAVLSGTFQDSYNKQYTITRQLQYY